MPGPVLIRVARVSEQPALEALQRRASLANEQDRAALQAHPDAIQLPIAQLAAGRVFVAECAQAIVGFAVVLRRADGDAELDGLFVDPIAWQGGIGRKLVAEAGRVARTDGASALYVVGNPHAADFYHACGFVAQAPCETRFGPAAILRMKLAAGAGDEPGC
jgi:N-acetylglutamate synthase-like GNAT family acetyltransferase